ncbi:hypothetical protein [Methanobrevibacter sp.]|uniref:hypothetical protein n=1 Tax=Methanobrevibacter sp. TaxID=66852 RepID=UPI0025F7DDEC|nr:hypothetical protein [Methanobrevibacter sp.]MBR4448371.1 hypothetical protein [Methanobrevibacter sp.]
MNRKTIEYIIIIIAVVLLIYASYFFINYQYHANEIEFDSITMLAPESSNYEIVGDAIEFRNPDSFYNMDVTKTNSDDAKVKSLLNALSNFNTGDITYYNESCYLVVVEYDNGNYNDHAIIIPVDSFDKDTLTFSKNTPVWLFDSNDFKFVVDSALNSEVVL